VSIDVDHGRARRNGASGRFGQLAFVACHVLVSRLVYVSAFGFGEMLKAGGFANGVQPLPSLRGLAVLIVPSAQQYGDFLWYKMVAEHGYDPNLPVLEGQRDWAFFPLFPAIMLVVHDARAWFLLSMAVFAASALLLHAYVRRVADEGGARAAVMLLCYFPYSFTVSQFRPETFMLALSLAAALLAISGRPLLAAAPAALAGFAKPNAFLVSLALGQGGGRIGLRRAIAMAASFAGLVAMSAVTWRVAGDPLDWARVQGRWGARFMATPVTQAREWFAHPMVVGRMGWDPMLIHYGLLAAVVVVAIRLVQARLAWLAAYLVAYVGLTFANFGVFVLGKHLSACFPFFVGAALLCRGRESALVALCAVGCALLALNGLFGGAALLFVMS
jgi:hypothetical protein